MLSCDKRLPLDTWNLSGTQENVFANPHSTLESSQTPDRGILHSTTPIATGEVPVRICDEKRNWKHNPSANICKQAVDHEILHHKENEDQFHKQQGRGLLSKEMTNNEKTQFQCRHLRQDRWLRVPQKRFNYHRVLWSDSKKQQISELQIGKVTTPSSFLYWKMRFKNQVTTCSDFPSKACT